MSPSSPVCNKSGVKKCLFYLISIVHNLRIGQRLTIYPRKPVTTQKTVVSTKTPAKPVGELPKDPSKVHVVQSGDSLWTISRKYPGISIDNLKKWNGLTGNNLKPGTKLRLCNCSS